ncbi:protein-arginine deiminase [Oscillatoriales cyanobacterium LEGE 11467]|uniref:Protein-arginine deiminase n=1 Tax=Zarconia navalis LEGE 11467 TaxID=1828826 RepID=A0A928ZB92_9CYAN|nr:protein-arginine deiminase domain-containing protein [Zarconia navalis]MBE9042431.1 protein-arginine deiminase [Zarconia navalis LEGE 11467]
MRGDRNARLWQILRQWTDRHILPVRIPSGAIVRLNPYQQWQRYGAIALAGTIGILLLGEGSRPRPALSPPAPCGWLAALDPPLPNLGSADSVDALYRIRERLDLEIDRCVGNLKLTEFAPQVLEVQTLEVQQESFERHRQAVDDRLEMEAQARQIWDETMVIAQSAIGVGKEAKLDRSQTPEDAIEIWRQTQSLWQQTLDSLDRIPDESILAPYKAAKTTEYRGYLAVVTNKLEIAQLATGFVFYGDTNRDGVADDLDYPGRQLWSLESGALMLFNNDDDDGDRVPDWEDTRVNGSEDEADLAIVRLQTVAGFKDSQIVLTADVNSREYVNVFQQVEGEWKPIDLTGNEPIVEDREIILGVEAKQFAYRNWNGILRLEATATKNGTTIAADRVQIRVSPWILSPNTAPTEEFFVSALGINREFVEQIKAIVPQTGAKLKVVPQGPTWMQDTMEIGYVQFPKANALKTVPSVLQGNRSIGLDRYPKSLLGKNFGWFKIGQPRPVPAGNGLPDWYGNLEVTPPLPNYPLGRIYYGQSGDVGMHPEVLEFVKAQEIQGPPVAIDTSWLLIRHVDEILSFIPTPDGGHLVMVASPEAGVNLLRELAEQGYGDRIINRGLSTQITIDAALANTNLVEHNLKIQRDYIDPTIEQLKREFQLDDSQIIQLPEMYTTFGAAWSPSTVNSVMVNGQLLVSDPRGAIVDDVDYSQKRFRQLIAASGLQVHFLNDRSYHEMRGNTHCATNTTRKAKTQPFWERLSGNGQLAMEN